MENGALHLPLAHGPVTPCRPARPKGGGGERPGRALLVGNLELEDPRPAEPAISGGGRGGSGRIELAGSSWPDRAGRIELAGSSGVLPRSGGPVQDRIT
jgi:hypothetical protein